MKKFAYCLVNSDRSKDFKKENFYEGERILYKGEEMKMQDGHNTQYNLNLYITNFRVAIINEQYVFDVPLQYITYHYVKKPIIMGSMYINLDLKYDNTRPLYILENLGNEITPYTLPKYCTVKFRGKNTDIDTAYKILKEAIANKDYNRSFKKKEVLPTETYTPSTTQVKGLGIERVILNEKNRLDESRSLIKNSFSDIETLRQNIDIAQNIRAKLNNTSGENNELNDINQVLQSIGFIDPVTKETAGKDFIEQLAKQINEFFSNYFKTTAEKGLGVMTLIDAYGVFNRARGINTISPSEMKNAVEMLDKMNLEIRSKIFKNEMIMIISNNFSLESINNKLAPILESKSFITINEFASTFQINTIFSKILIEVKIK